MSTSVFGSPLAVGEKFLRGRIGRIADDDRAHARTYAATATFGQSLARLDGRRVSQPSIATAPDAKSIG